MTTTTPLAREYLRVSRDRSGRARSVDEQHQDNERAADQHGYRLNGEAYSDVDLSASRYATKVRGDFARLIADLQHGRFGADMLVLWESSRGSRRVGEWVELLELCETRHVGIHVTTHGRTYDPARPRDRRTLLEDAVDSEYESAKTSDRIKRTAAATAAEGGAWGRVPYGFERRYQVGPSGRRVLLGQVPHPDEAPVVRELYERLRQGHSLRSIAADFAARGITSRSGKPFSAVGIRDMALRPAYAGLRVHDPAARGKHHMPLDSAVRATWEPLVPREVYDQVRARLLDPQRVTWRPGRARHLLSGIGTCECGSPLTVRFRAEPAPRLRSGDTVRWRDDPAGGRQRDYVCRDRGCVRIDAGELDTVAEAVMLGYLARPDVIEGLRAGGGDDAALEAVRGDLAAARAELTALRAAARARKLSVATLVDVEPGLVQRVGELETAERDLTRPPVLAGLIEPGEDVAARWQAAPMTARRQVARLLCVPEILGTLAVRRTGQGNHVPAHDRVTWRITQA